MTAGEALMEAATAALRSIAGLGVFDSAPVQAAVPYALVESDFETQWGHKSGDGRELRLAVTIRDAGERPERLRRLMAEAETAVTALDADLDGWRIVTLLFLRSRLVPPRSKSESWTGVLEFRARMLAT